MNLRDNGAYPREQRRFSPHAGLQGSVQRAFFGDLQQPRADFVGQVADGPDEPLQPADSVRMEQASRSGAGSIRFAGPC